MAENYLTLWENSMERWLSKSLFLVTLTTTSFVFVTLGWGAKANTPPILEVKDTEVTSYAESVLQMEPKRQKAFEEIKQLIGDKEIPKIVCNDPKSIDTLPGKAKNVAVSYCNSSQEIVTTHNLTIDRFNQITLEIQKNNDLKRKVYNTLIRLQKESAEKQEASKKPK
jgi:hypothetical protein